jgi:hypothetical protein
MARASPNEHNGKAVLEEQWTRVEAKLQQAKDRLVTAGCIVRCNRPGRPTVFVLRYRERSAGRTWRRAIFLGPEAIARRARVLIRKWRDATITPEERHRREAWGWLDKVARARGYSGRARKRLKAAYAACAGDRLAELRLNLRMNGADGDIRCGKRPGRPAKARLW